MKFRKLLSMAVSFALSGILAVGIVVAADCAAVFFHLRMVPAVFFGLLAILLVGIHFCRFFTAKRKLRCIAVLAAVAAVIWVAGFAVWHPFQKNAAYVSADQGKAALYADRSVMVIVPHQDDEANILSGVLEAFSRYGSDVKVVFVTNGDYDGIPQTRLREAIAYCDHVGIPEENVIFLGYGDRWDLYGGVNLYNAPSGEVIASHYGAYETYALDDHPAYRQGNSYTVDNLLSDMQAVILEYRPEVIFCIDYEDHIEHQSVSLNFEKGMGAILKQNPGYRPVVLKAYAYGTAWYAQEDFYGINIPSTRDLFREPYLQSPAIYRWEDGIRLPVEASTLSRSLVASQAFQSLEQYTSQNAQYRAQAIVNGDRIFWQRRTDSLCLEAEVEVSSGEAGLLNNFMLLDNFDLRESALPEDGVWIPEESDGEKWAKVVLNGKQDVEHIVLYDHPSDEHNIVNAVVEFDDGTRLETGPLDPNGTATKITVQKTDVQWFRVLLPRTEGSKAGLGEIEAFSGPSQGDLKYVKIVDDAGNFIYDYAVTEGTVARFGINTWGDVSEELADYTVLCDNPAIRWSVEGENLVLDCPAGETGTIRISSEQEGIADSVFVRNPGPLWRIHTAIAQRIEQYAVFQFRETILSRVGRRVVGMLKG